MKQRILSLIASGAGFIPGLGSLTVFLNPTVLVVILATAIVSFLYGNHIGTTKARAVCLAAAKVAEAQAATVDRDALQDQIDGLEKAIEESVKDKRAAEQRVSDYENRIKALGPNSGCSLTAPDIDGL